MLKPYKEREEAVADICAPEMEAEENLSFPGLPGEVVSEAGIAKRLLGEGLEPSPPRTGPAAAP